MARPQTRLTPAGVAALRMVAPGRAARDKATAEAAARFVAVLRAAVDAGVPLARIGAEAGLSAEGVRRMVLP